MLAGKVKTRVRTPVDSPLIPFVMPESPAIWLSK